MDHQRSKQGYFPRAVLAAGLTWLVLTFQGLVMRAFHRMDLEMIVTISVVTFLASILAGLAVAALVRKNSLTMVVVSQLVGIALVGFAAKY